MSVAKIPFTAAVADMKKKPNDPVIVDRYYDQVTKLSKMLMNQYKMNYQDQEDAVQDLVEFTLKKGLHKKVELTGDPFSYFWTTFKREIWRKQREAAAKIDKVQKHGIFDQQNSDNNQGEEYMLKSLGFKLEDFELVAENGFDKGDLEKLPAVETSKPKRGRPPKLNKSGKAEHWEQLFETLKTKKQMSDEQIINAIPMEKRYRLKNPINSAKTALRDIAKRDGYELTISNGVFNLIGA